MTEGNEDNEAASHNRCARLPTSFPSFASVPFVAEFARIHKIQPKTELLQVQLRVNSVKLSGGTGCGNSSRRQLT
jgi:hypothetical protein